MCFPSGPVLSLLPNGESEVKRGHAVNIRSAFIKRCIIGGDPWACLTRLCEVSSGEGGIPQINDTTAESLQTARWDNVQKPDSSAHVTRNERRGGKTCVFVCFGLQMPSLFPYRAVTRHHGDFSVMGTSSLQPFLKSYWLTPVKWLANCRKACKYGELETV